MAGLTKQEVELLVRKTAESLTRDECRGCDCFRGFLTQLELDSTEDVSDLLAPWKVIDQKEMHGCLGCDPCASGAAYAKYQKETRGA